MKKTMCNRLAWRVTSLLAGMSLAAASEYDVAAPGRFNDDCAQAGLGGVHLMADAGKAK